MNYFSTSSLSKFIDDIEKKDLSTPFGGSVIILNLLSSIQLIKLTLQFSMKTKNTLELKNYLNTLENIKKSIIPFLDKDIYILQDILSAYKSKNQEKITDTLKKSVLFNVSTLEKVYPIASFLESFVPICNINLLSDLFIALEMYFSGIKGISILFFINLKNIKDKNFTQKQKIIWTIKYQKLQNLKKNILKILSSQDTIFSKFI